MSYRVTIKLENENGAIFEQETTEVIYLEGNIYISIDNQGGNAFMEENEHLKDAVKHLEGEDEA